MSIKNIENIQHYLEKLPGTCLIEVIEYLRFLEFKSKNKMMDRSSVILSKESLLKDWLTIEEDKAWKHL